MAAEGGGDGDDAKLAAAEMHLAGMDRLNGLMRRAAEEAASVALDVGAGERLRADEKDSKSTGRCPPCFPAPAPGSALSRSFCTPHGPGMAFFLLRSSGTRSEIASASTTIHVRVGLTGVKRRFDC